jgi:hypothetical protein
MFEDGLLGTNPSKTLADLATNAPRGEAFEGSTNGGLMQ